RRLEAVVDPAAPPPDGELVALRVVGVVVVRTRDELVDRVTGRLSPRVLRAADLPEQERRTLHTTHRVGESADRPVMTVVVRRQRSRAPVVPVGSVDGGVVRISRQPAGHLAGGSAPGTN